MMTRETLPEKDLCLPLQEEDKPYGWANADESTKGVD